jgi:hypothetical protein
MQQGVSGPDRLDYAATFCNHALTWISREYKPTTGMLFELLGSLKEGYGEPTVQTVSSLWAEGRARTLHFRFRAKPDDNLTIAVNLQLNTDTAFGLQVYHEIDRMRCE